MSLEEFKKIEASKLSPGKLITVIAKNQTLYLNHHLEELNINASQLHFLYEIYYQKEINQEKIASRCNINKSAVARSIKKLEDNELIVRQIDNNNRRQNIVSLTSKGEETLKKAMKQLEKWEEKVFNDVLIEKETLQKILREIAIKSIEFNEGE